MLCFYWVFSIRAYCQLGLLMGLGSVLNTALSGVSAAETWIDVTANNLANVNTDGFKASTVRFGTLAPQTRSAGSAPRERSGGSNPVQTGKGVQVSAITVDHRQGQLAVDRPGSGIAIWGDGLFILEGPRGERFYARDGDFSPNAASELVNASGYRVLGYATDGRGQIDTTRLSPLRIAIGSQVPGVDGSAATLKSYSFAEDGQIVGHYTDGIHRPLGQIRLARFANPRGLRQESSTHFSQTPAAGSPFETNPGEAGAGTLAAGASELSNTDIGRSLIELSQAKTMFRANLAVVDTAGSLLDELAFLRR
jgi:flagellar hook protein FlgE